MQITVVGTIYLQVFQLLFMDGNHSDVSLPYIYFEMLYIYSQWGTVKLWSVGSKGHCHGLNGLRFTQLSNPFASIPLYCPHRIHGISNFQLSTCPDFIENIYFLNSNSFQASSHQYLQITYILNFFFKFC